MQIRKLSVDDREAFLNLLSQLTQVGEISKEAFLERLHVTDNMVYVIELDGLLVGTGSLLIERKFIHECGLVGHIEDVVVNTQYRGQGLGRILIEFLTNLAREAGCYKVILDASEEKAAFYERCGFVRKNCGMALYLM